MRVLHVSNDLGASSGVGTFVRHVIAELAARGIEAPVVSSAGELDAAAARGLPDAVHIHGLWLGLHHVAATWARAKGVPVVWSTHGMTAPWAMRHKWWKKLPAWWFYQARDLKGAARVHCTTELEVEWNRARGLTRTFVAPLGTEVEESGVEREGGGGGPLRVLFVGRIYPVKGLMNLVRAAGLANADAAGRVSPRGVEFRIVGPDQGGHRAELERACARLGVRNFTFVGEKRGAELSAEYEACDVLVLPSFTENFGGVVADALAHGKPVIASRFTPWDVLERSGCGWWVENSPESLAKTIGNVAGLPPETLAEMGRRGRALVEARYSWSAVGEVLARVYGGLRAPRDI